MIQPRGRFGRLVRPARLPGRIKTWRAAVLALAVLAGLAGPARYASGATGRHGPHRQPGDVAEERERGRYG
jgi:hypothetical protein